MKRITFLAALALLVGCSNPQQSPPGDASPASAGNNASNPVALTTPESQATPPQTPTSTPAPAKKPLGPEVKTKSGLRYQLFQKGKGDVAKKNQKVYVHYTGVLENGTKFDSSLDRGVPIDFVLGTGAVIKGWDEGIEGMKVGEKRKLIIPPDLAYGDAGAGGVIPPGATLIFDVELVKVE